MQFQQRHIGPDEVELDKMLTTIGVDSLDALIDQTVPDSIRLDGTLDLRAPLTEVEVLDDLRDMATTNTVARSLIGQGYFDTITPAVILRNVTLIAAVRPSSEINTFW